MTPGRSDAVPLPAMRRQVRALRPAGHGGLHEAELRPLGIDPARLLDFSVCTNPFGPAPGVRAALVAADPSVYPDRDATALRAALTESLGIGADRILVGNGTSELIWLVALAFVRSGDRALVLGPTFDEYARAVRLMGGKVRTWRAKPETGFGVDLGSIERFILRVKPRLGFLCNPNNPTGVVLPASAITALAARSPRTLFIVDEAYLAFTKDAESCAGAGDNILVLRSMTKDHALAGLRLGYANGDARLIEALRRVQPPWSVNGLAQAAGVAALADSEHVHKTLARVACVKEELLSSLRSVGMEPLPSRAHFFLLRVGSAGRVRRALLERGILVRDCTSFGLPEYIRLAPRGSEDNRRLVAALGEVLG